MYEGMTRAEVYEYNRNRVIQGEGPDVFKARETAYLWHGGQFSALYSFASTGAVVHSEDHRGDLEWEIAGILKAKNLSEDDREDLENLLNAVKALPVKPS